jgi:peptide/nickel transport system substrate-binding protein
MDARRRKRFLGAVTAVAATALVAAGCSSGGSKPSASGSSGAKVAGGVATVGQIAGAVPNYIWPYMGVDYYTVPNAQDFQWLMYRPLYFFGNNGDSTLVNYPMSTANAPVYSNGGRTVTITMKGWKWSNGESVDASDVAFWLNMLKAEKEQYAGYSPGSFPDDLASLKVTSADTIVLNLTRAFASTWFTYNQLAEITPMPAAWDVTSAGAAPGSGGCATNVSDCKAVWTFLAAQAKETSSYASSPIWGVVDGPWKLSAFNLSGADTFVPNKSYGGSPKPSISKLEYVPFTSDTTEYTALRTGSLDVAAVGVGIPAADLPPKPANSALPATNPLGSGYYLEPFYSFAIAYAPVDFKNPTLGAAYSQLYFRQALEYINDQEGIAKTIFRGYAYPTTGPVPPEPVNPFEPAVEKENGGAGAYPFSVAKAKALLTSHGWSEVGGVMTCENPSLCGAGVKKGTQAKFTMDYTTGFSTLAQEVDVYKSDASEAGIDINVAAESFNTLIGTVNQGSTSWAMANISGWAYDGPGYLPTGEPLFQTGAPSNQGSYHSTEEDSLIKSVESNSSMSLFHQYGTYTAEQLPFIWMPQSYWVQPIKDDLHGVTFSPYYSFTPEYWYFTK